MPTATIDPQTKVREAIKRINALATLPEITAKIISTVEDPRSSAGKLHQIISHDPALVTRILIVVNSAFYGLPGQIASVERAIVLLGLNAVKNIAVAASLGQLFRNVKLCDGSTARDLWVHSVAVAVCARDLARQIRPAITEEAFLAGMIHDIGILAELQLWPEQFRNVCKHIQANPGDFCAAERQLLGFDHQMVGKALAEQWKFPLMCQNAAAFHHNPAGRNCEGALLVQLVYVADTLCCQNNHGFTLTALSQTLDDQVISDCGITPAALELVKANLASQVSDAVTVFG